MSRSFWAIWDIGLAPDIRPSEAKHIRYLNIGYSKRSRYAVVGSGVNMTTRIESYAVGGQILVSESVRREAAEEFVYLNAYGNYWKSPSSRL